VSTLRTLEHKWSNDDTDNSNDKSDLGNKLDEMVFIGRRLSSKQRLLTLVILQLSLKS